MISAKVGNLPVVKCIKYGEEVQGITLKEVNLNPAANLSLFSITKRQKEGWKINWNDKAVWLTKGSRKVFFDMVIKNPKGGFFCAYLKINSEEVEEYLDGMKPNISIQLAHEILGHMDE